MAGNGIEPADYDLAVPPEGDLELVELTNRFIRALGEQAVEGLSLEEYRQGPFRKKGAERMLQEAIDVAVDTNLHLLRTPAGFRLTA